MEAHQEAPTLPYIATTHRRGRTRIKKELTLDRVPGTIIILPLRKKTREKLGWLGVR